MIIVRQEQLSLTFDCDCLRPSYYELMFDENKDNQKTMVFKPEGKTTFDDLKEIKQCLPHKLDQLQLAEVHFPPDYYNHTRIIPKTRASGEQEAYFKSSALPGYEPEPLSSIYSLPIKVPAHHFIYNDDSIRRYHNYGSINEKDA